MYWLIIDGVLSKFIISMVVLNKVEELVFWLYMPPVESQLG